MATFTILGHKLIVFDLNASETAGVFTDDTAIGGMIVYAARRPHRRPNEETSDPGGFGPSGIRQEEERMAETQPRVGHLRGVSTNDTKKTGRPVPIGQPKPGHLRGVVQAEGKGGGAASGPAQRPRATARRRATRSPRTSASSRHRVAEAGQGWELLTWARP